MDSPFVELRETDMNAHQNEPSNREISDVELKIEELDHVTGGSMNDMSAAMAACAQAQAQGVVRIGR
jgi:hypothetical protein